MITDTQFRSRTAFLRFQHSLESLEHELKPLESKMSEACAFELKMVGVTARSFFRMANEELFGKKRQESLAVHSTEKEG